MGVGAEVGQLEWMQSILMVLRDGLNSMCKWNRRGRLNHVTDSQDSRVDFKGADVLQEESVEARRHKVESVRVSVGRLEIRNKLQALVIKRQRSVTTNPVNKKELKLDGESLKLINYTLWKLWKLQEVENF